MTDLIRFLAGRQTGRLRTLVDSLPGDGECGASDTPRHGEEGFRARSACPDWWHRISLRGHVPGQAEPSVPRPRRLV